MEKKSFMTKLAEGIVANRIIIVILFAAMSVFSLFSIGWVDVENEFTTYLPEEAEARRALTIMEEEFVTYGSANVLVKDVSRETASELAETLEGVEHVASVTFDDSEDHYKDSNALYALSFDNVATDPTVEAAMEEVRDLLTGTDFYVDTEIGFSLADMLADQMVDVLIFVVIVVLAVLVFTSSNYAEIAVMLLVFIVSALINMGTHFLMGTISFVSDSVAIVMQLALSVDYAIIFCNRYKEEHESLPIRPAVEKALAASIPEISASSLTTIAGLGAMTFMEFRLGADMGFTLIKAIACSLLTVFLFMPAMLILFGNLMDRTKHRNFVPKISFLGKFAYATRYIIPILFVGLVIGAYAVFSHCSYDYCGELVEAHRKTEQELAQAEVEEYFGATNMLAMLVPAGDYESEKALLQEIADCDEVDSALGIAGIEAMDGYCLGDAVTAADFQQLAGVDETAAAALFAYYAAQQGDERAYLDQPEEYSAPLIEVFLFLHDALEDESLELEVSQEQRDLVDSLYTQLSMARDQMQGDRYSRLIIYLNLPVQSEETFTFLERLHIIAGEYYPDNGDADTVLLTGDSVSAKDFQDSFASDNTTVGLLSLGMVMLILLLTFRSFGMPLLLILVIQGSIWINFAIATLQGSYVFFLCYLIVSSIQMGANIDYAIVVSSRYRELRAVMDRKEAAIETLNLAFPTIITSGLMMICAGLLVGNGVAQCVIAGMGYYVGTGTIISVLLIMLALPQLLILGDRFITATTVASLPKLPFLVPIWKKRRVITAVLLLVAAVLSFLAAGVGIGDARSYREDTESYAESMTDTLQELRQLSRNLEVDADHYNTLQYKFAEQAVTDSVGYEMLEEGQSEYEEGLEEYLAGKAEYDAGAEELDDAKKQYYSAYAKLEAGQQEYDEGVAAYNAAKQQLAEGQAQYDAGMAEYEAGQAAYAAAEQQLADGQAQYDAGLAQYNEGQSAYDSALSEYNASKAVLDAIAPTYNSVMSAYNDYQANKQAYDEAVAAGDTETAASLYLSVTLSQIAFESALGTTGYSISGLLDAYSSAQSELSAAEGQLADAKAQLSAAEAELSAAKAELDEGYAQLDAAKAKLDAAETELADAKAQLDDGYAQLDAAEVQLADGKAQLEDGYSQLRAAKKQIDAGDDQLDEAKAELDAGQEKLSAAEQELAEGRAELEENRAQLSSSLEELEALNSDEEKLTAGIELLMEQPGIEELTGLHSTTAEVLDAAASYFSQLRTTASEIGGSGQFLSWLLILAALLAIVAVVLRQLTRKSSGLYAGAVAGCAALVAGVTALFWRSRCSGLTGFVLVMALILLVLSAIYAEVLFRGTLQKENHA